MRNKFLKILIIVLLVIITIAVLSVINSYNVDANNMMDVSLNDFRDAILKKSFSEVNIFGTQAEGIESASLTGQFSGKATMLPTNFNDWVNLMLQKGIPVKIKTIEDKMRTSQVLLAVLNNIIPLVIYIFFLKYMLGGSAFTSKKYEFIKSNITFKDVAGMKQIKREVVELIDFLKNKEKYASFGCRTPKGLIISGPPGNGKTLIAKAIAGESDVNFIATSASSFIEIFVGTGPRAIRELFAAARKNTPCVIFIDEMDSLGKRNQGFGSSETDKTINQFLAEMDGVVANEGLLVIGATNHPDSIDEAALRSGRFDRHLSVTNPNYQERKLVIELYTKNIPLDFSVSIDRLARNTNGLSRADLENMVNEAKIYAVRHKCKYITDEHFKYAFDKILLGLPLEKIVDDDLKNTAYHESGHAFFYYYHQKILGKIYKATVVPHAMKKGVALGFVMPENNDKKSMSRSQFEATIQMALAGRISEETFFGLENATIGCSSDLQKARQLAENYVIYGLSDEFGLGYLSLNNETRSEEEKNKLNMVVNNLIKEMEQKTREIVIENKEKIERVAKRLLEEDTLTGEQIYDEFDGKVFLPTTYQIKSGIKLSQKTS